MNCTTKTIITEIFTTQVNRTMKYYFILKNMLFYYSTIYLYIAVDYIKIDVMFIANDAL